jgi:hypothetical protein
MLIMPITLIGGNYSKQCPYKRSLHPEIIHIEKIPEDFIAAIPFCP